MSDPDNQGKTPDSEELDRFSDAIENSKQTSPEIPLRGENITPASSIKSTSSTRSRLEAQKRMHSEARQAQAARNSITSITSSPHSSSYENSNHDQLITNGPHDEDLDIEEDEDVEKVLKAEMVSDEELSARNLESLIKKSIIDLFLVVPILALPAWLVFFLTSFEFYNISEMKDPANMNAGMEFIRYNVFTAIAYALFVIFDVLSLVVPEAILIFIPVSKSNTKTQRFIRSQLHMVIHIREYFAVTVWLFSIILLAASILYQSVFTSPTEILAKIIGSKVDKAVESAVDAGDLSKLIAEGKHTIIQRYIEVSLVLLAIFSFVFAIERYLIQMVKLGFHRQAFAERISNSNRRFSHLLKLYEAVKFGKPRVLSNSVSSLLDIDSTADLNIDKALHLSSVHRAKSVSKLIFSALLPSDGSGRDYLTVEDFKKWTSTPEEAFAAFDSDGLGKVDEGEMEDSVVEIYSARSNLSRGLKANGRIVKTLDYIFLFVSFIIAGLISSPIFDIGASNFITYMGILSTAFGFIFHSTAKSCFESLLFVFIQHPFDVGDRVIIDNETFIIENIEIITTKMVRWDGVAVYISNSALFTKIINNIRRSKNQFESLALKIKGDNATESLFKFHEQIKRELQVYAHSFTGIVELTNLDKLPDTNEPLNVTVTAQVYGNFQNPAKRNSRKSELMEAVDRALKSSNLSKA